MKKIIIVLLAAAASFTAANKASAQEKGLWIGGKLGYWHDKTEGVKTDSFSIAPEAGYDFNKRWSVGVALGYEYLKVKDGGSANVFTASPYARYKYYNKGILSLFLDGGVGFAGCTSRRRSPSERPRFRRVRACRRRCCRHKTAPAPS